MHVLNILWSRGNTRQYREVARVGWVGLETLCSFQSKLFFWNIKPSKIFINIVMDSFIQSAESSYFQTFKNITIIQAFEFFYYCNISELWIKKICAANIGLYHGPTSWLWRHPLVHVSPFKLTEKNKLVFDGLQKTNMSAMVCQHCGAGKISRQCRMGQESVLCWPLFLLQFSTRIWEVFSFKTRLNIIKIGVNMLSSH